ncbi:MAG: hypothetical protein H0W96_12235 [Solirubrobacterales bacterium]|nr:hypothetical protein [Solirubrobacterales bacterium]
MTHIEQLLARDRADLSHTERRELTAHLGVCGACRSLAADLDRSDALLREKETLMSIPRFHEISERRRTALPQLLAAGAALILIVLVLAPLFAARNANVAGPGSGPNPGVSSSSPTATPRSEQTKPPGMGTQPQLPLVTSVRWAVDRRSTGTLLVLLYEGSASSFRVVDGNGATVLRFSIAGSGIFGPETCVVRARQPQELTTWLTVDEATLEAFMQRYRTYRVIADGVPGGEATLPLVDSGCRGAP